MEINGIQAACPHRRQGLAVIGLKIDAFGPLPAFADIVQQGQLSRLRLVHGRTDEAIDGVQALSADRADESYGSA